MRTSWQCVYVCAVVRGCRACMRHTRVRACVQACARTFIDMMHMGTCTHVHACTGLRRKTLFFSRRIRIGHACAVCISYRADYQHAACMYTWQRACIDGTRLIMYTLYVLIMSCDVYYHYYPYYHYYHYHYYHYCRYYLFR